MNEKEALNKIFGSVVLSTYEDKYDNIMKETRDVLDYQDKIGNPYAVHKAVEYAIREINKLNNENNR